MRVVCSLIQVESGFAYDLRPVALGFVALQVADTGAQQTQLRLKLVHTMLHVCYMAGHLGFSYLNMVSLLMCCLCWR